MTAESAAQAGAASATAESLFREGKELMDHGKYPEACAKFEASYVTEETLGTLLNLANCHELEGRTASAWAEFLRAGAMARTAGQEEREDVSRDRARALEPKLMRLQIDVPEAVRVMGLELTRDGVPIEAAAWGSAIPVDPGEHRVRATAPGKEPSEHTVQLAREGATVVLELIPLQEAVEPIAAAPPPPPPRAAVPTPAQRPRAEVGVDSTQGSGQRTIGMVLGAVGVAGLAASGGLGVLARNEWDDAQAAGCEAGSCPTPEAQRASEDAFEYASYGTIGVIGGSALLVSGALLYFTAPSEDGAGARVETQFSGEHALVEVRGTF